MEYLEPMERLKQDLKNNNFRNIYLLYGEEAYLRKYYMKSLRNAIIGDDTMNFTYFEGKDTQVGAIRDLGDTMPFFSERRLIIIENSGLIKSGGDELAEYLKAIPEYLFVIMVESEIDKRTKLYKTLNSEGTCVELKPYTGQMQKVWISGFLKRFNKKMSDQDIEHLVTMTGDDMVNLESELNKLIDYTGDREIITAADADAIVTKQIDDDIFKMTEAMGHRNQPLALKYYYDLLAARTPAVKILVLVTRQFNQLLQVKELKALHYSSKDIASKVGIPPFFMNKYLAQAECFTLDQLQCALEACAQADQDFKTGRIKDVLAVELLIIEFSKG